ncbi:MAG: hypothetical protein MH204_09365, partial [Fimbriimonadaceae bacterium]|nr:hypothetical protein [Fimbriimonadaceae bacterium]
MEQQSLKQPDSGIISEDRISEVMALAERLRQASGGILDEEHIEAIEEATGTPRETIRVLVRSMESNIRLPVWDRLRSQLATLDSRLKNSVGVGTLGVISGVLFALSTRMIVGGQMAASFAVLSATLALIVSLHGRDRIASGILGALWGAIHFFSYQVAATFIALIVRGPSPEMGWGVFPLFVIAGFFFSLVGRHFWDTLRQTLGWMDPSQQRKALVQQLMEIQDRLKAEERNAAYLSLDVVGST